MFKFFGFRYARFSDEESATTYQSYATRMGWVCGKVQKSEGGGYKLYTSCPIHTFHDKEAGITAAEDRDAEGERIENE